MDELTWNILEDKQRGGSALVNGVELREGDRVLLKPRPGGDIFDLALAGKTAFIESIEEDYDDNVHFAVVLEDDPGRDLGMLRQPGHRFFFTPAEVEPLLPSEFKEAEI